MWARKQGGVASAVESKHKGKCKDMGVFKTTSIVVFYVLVGLVRMRLIWLMAEQTHMEGRGVFDWKASLPFVRTECLTLALSESLMLDDRD